MTSAIKPKTIRLEVSTHCQLKCPSCETAQGKIAAQLGSGFLKLENFQKIIDENPYISNIEISNWGEVFLNPDLSAMMKYADRNNVSLTASNGVNLNTVKEEVLEDLVKYKFRHLTCSIDGASQETYSIYRINGNFERVIKNIKIINYYKTLYESNLPLLTWQFVVFGHNEHEIETVKQLAESLNMSVQIKLSWDENVSPIKNKSLVKNATTLGVTSRSEYIQKYGIDYLQTMICSQLWESPQINWDGKVLGCCYNYWGDFGNAFELGITQGLNNEKISYARKMLLGQVEAQAGIPCTNCGHYQRMKKNNKWLIRENALITSSPKIINRINRLIVMTTKTLFKALGNR